VRGIGVDGLAAFIADAHVVEAGICGGYAADNNGCTDGVGDGLPVFAPFVCKADAIGDSGHTCFGIFTDDSVAWMRGN